MRVGISPDRLRAICLDAGNTLVFLDFEAIAAAVRSSGIAVAPSRLERSEYEARRRVDRAYAEGGETDRGMWDRYMSWILERAGVPAPARGAIVGRLRREHERSNLWRRTEPEIHAALEKLRDRGFRLAVISNSDGSCRDLMQRTGYLDVLEAVIDSTEVGCEKPSPAIFRRALEALDVLPEQALYAGDLLSVDVEGARRAGLLPVWIDPRGSVSSAGCPVLRSVAELPRALGLGD